MTRTRFLKRLGFVVAFIVALLAAGSVALLLAGGITAMGPWFALIAAAIVEMDQSDVFRFRRTVQRLDDLSDHVVVIAISNREARDEGTLVCDPGPDERIRPGDAPIDLGKQDQVDGLRAIVGP